MGAVSCFCRFTGWAGLRTLEDGAGGNLRIGTLGDGAGGFGRTGTLGDGCAGSTIAGDLIVMSLSFALSG